MPRQNPADLPDVVKTAARVNVTLHQAVARMARRHKFGVGMQLCESALGIWVNLHFAWFYPNRRIHHTQQASDLIDHLRIRLQLAQGLNAFASFAQFEDISRLVDSLGQQCGGWRNELRRQQGQNAPGSSRPQRAQTLSARDASKEAQP